MMIFKKLPFLFLFLSLPVHLKSQRPLIPSEIKKHRLKYFQEMNLVYKTPYASQREYYDTSGRTLIRVRAMMIKDTLQLDSTVYSYEPNRLLGLQQFINGLLIENTSINWQSDTCRITEGLSRGWRNRGPRRSVSKYKRTSQGSITESNTWENDTLREERYSRSYGRGDSIRVWVETLHFYGKGKARKFTDSSVTLTRNGEVQTETWTDNIKTSISTEKKGGYYSTRDLENGKVVKLYEHFRDSSGRLIKVCHSGRKVKTRCSNYEYEDKWEEGRHCRVMITRDDKKKIVYRNLRYLDSRNWINEAITYDENEKVISHMLYRYEYW